MTRQDGVAVVIVTYNSHQWIDGCIASLGEGLAGVDWHLVVVDNASADDTLQRVVRIAPDATVVQTGRNAGYAAGINAGVAAAGPHDAILVLNPDVRLKPGCVSLLMAALSRPNVGIAVPNLVDGDGVLIETMRREPSILRAWGDALIGARRAGRVAALSEVVSDTSSYAHEARVDWAEGSTLLISAECWKRCAPWEESFFLYSEETDFALRARDAGLGTLYYPQAEAIHLEGDSRVSPGLWTLLMMNRVRLFRRRHGVAATASFWAALVVREASRAAMGKRTSRSALRNLIDPRSFREPPSPAVVQRLNGRS